MNFKEQLKAIENYTLEECTQIHEFMLDYEHLHLEECINTGYRHKRLTNFTDNQLHRLADAFHDRVMELI